MAKWRYSWWVASAMAAMSLSAVVAGARLASPEASVPVPNAPTPTFSTAVSDCCGGSPPSEPVPPPRPGRRVLRIAADPNNLPFTNDRREGFENRIADLLAADLGAELEYVWRAQRRGFFRTAFKEGEADLVLGVPAGFDMALTTAPYSRSTYVFVSRKDRKLGIASFDDPALKTLRIGVQMIGDDGSNTPPAHALAARGLVENAVGFTLYGDYKEANPPARIVEAVAKGDEDVAVAWGPMAGYFAKRQAVALDLTPVTPAAEASGLRQTFAIAVGVRKGDRQLRDEIDAALAKRKADIDAILAEYGVPRVAVPKKGDR